MEKFEFIEYTAKRYGIDESLAETLVDIFADCLQELICSGTNVNIDEIGEFRSIPLFPEEINQLLPSKAGSLVNACKAYSKRKR